MRRLLVGIAVAAMIAVSLTDLAIFGVEAWKVVLGAVGLVIFLAAGSGPHATPEHGQTRRAGRSSKRREIL